jgi:hypothetical protein
MYKFQAVNVTKSQGKMVQRNFDKVLVKRYFEVVDIQKSLNGKHQYPGLPLAEFTEKIRNYSKRINQSAI